MAEEKAQKPEEQEESAAAPKKRGVKIALIVLGIMVLEGAAMFVLLGMLAGPPPSAAAEIKGKASDLEGFTEIKLVEDRFQNLQTGKTWVWEVSVVLKVPVRNQAVVTAALEHRAAEIKEGVARIFRKAQHSHLRESELITISRQLTAYVDEVLGKDAEGESRIDRVIIPKCQGFPVEG